MAEGDRPQLLPNAAADAYAEACARSRPAVARENDLDEALERHAARDWAWQAVERLSPPLRLVTILRYFSEARTFEEIATVCGVPVGMVRSRLSTARAKLCCELLAASSAPHDDAAALTEARRQEAADAQSAAERGHFGDFLRETWSADVETVWTDGTRTHGLAPVRQAVDTSMEFGSGSGSPTSSRAGTS